MSQQRETGTVTFIAGEDLATKRRVRLSAATEMTVVYADAGEPCDGVTQKAVDSGDRVPVKLINAPGTFNIVAGATTTVNAKLYGAADGKVSETVSGRAEFFGLEAASGDASVIECLPIPAAEMAESSAADFQDSVADRLTVPGGSETAGYRALVIATATGAFASQEDSIAILEQDASWTFIAPTEGMIVRVEDEDVLYQYDGASWSTVLELGGLSIADAGDIAVGTATGTKIGTATSQKIGLWNATPVVQPAHNADPAACVSMTATLTGVDTGTDMTAAQAATIVADLAALKTAVDANNAAIDAINADCATVGLTAAS